MKLFREMDCNGTGARLSVLIRDGKLDIGILREPRENEPELSAIPDYMVVEKVTLSVEHATALVHALVGGIATITGKLMAETTVAV